MPHVEAIHELGAEEAEECLLALSVEVPLLPPTFRHLVRHCVAGAGADFPDLRAAYALYRTQLELLAAAKDGVADRTWVLKCPAHVPFLGDLLAEFPDARVVWAHRLRPRGARSFGATSTRVRPAARVLSRARRGALAGRVVRTASDVDAIERETSEVRRPRSTADARAGDPKFSLPSLGSMFRTFADMCDAGDVDLGAIGAEQLAFWSAAVASAEACVQIKSSTRLQCARMRMF